MQRVHADEDRLRYLVGDVRDLPRLIRASRGVDVIVHAAAMKQVPACEYNPFEAVQTNVVGAENVVSAAIENDVPLTVALSTDKAVNPVNLYGATKLCQEKIVVQGNAYAADSVARFACVRYGNVVGSRGSVIPLFKAQAETGVLTLTDPQMTRFWITLDQAVDFVLDCMGRMGGGEVFVPKIPSMRVMDIAEALAPDAERRVIGIRPGEKLHEVLVTEDESRHCIETDNSYVILPEYWSWPMREHEGVRLDTGFRYTSDNNDAWLTVDDLRDIAAGVQAVG
jgi:UDP-N-acetylglucosamine 4,6-dehydratase/5-epimerase